MPNHYAIHLKLLLYVNYTSIKKNGLKPQLEALGMHRENDDNVNKHSKFRKATHKKDGREYRHKEFGFLELESKNYCKSFAKTFRGHPESAFHFLSW